MSTKLNTTGLLVIALLGSLPHALAQDPSSEPPKITLTQCYHWAAAQNEELKIRERDIEQSKARARGALGSALPDLRWSLTNTWQDPNGVDKLESQGFSGFVEKEQTESRFSLEQSLFSGFREFSAMSGFKKEVARDRLLLQRASLELFEQTAQAFYEVLNEETSLANTNAAYQLAADRIKELQDFIRLGKARDSEIFTAKAYAAGLKAKMDQTRARINSAREELSYLTGQNLSVPSLDDGILSSAPVSGLDDALIRSENRSDLKAQESEVEAMKLRVRYEKGFYWPTASVTGNYYTQRATFLDEIDWDVVLSVELPLYQGGTVSANVREARAAYRQALLTLEKMKRYIRYYVRKTHGQLTAAIQESQSLTEAVHAAEESYNSLRKEYRLGLVTNLDVIQALDFLQEQKTALDEARYNVKRLFIQLHVATEQKL